MRAGRRERGRFLESASRRPAGPDGDVLPNQGRQPVQSGKSTITDHHQRSIR